jgi:hypothetical protein
MDLRSKHQNSWPGLPNLFFNAVPQKLEHDLSEHGLFSKKEGTSHLLA